MRWLRVTQGPSPIVRLCVISLLFAPACGGAQEDRSEAPETPPQEAAPASLESEGGDEPPVPVDVTESEVTDDDSLLLRFDEVATGSVSEELEIAETAGAGRRATWEVVSAQGAPSPPHAFGITANTNRGRTYNIALSRGSSFDDVDITVAVRAVAGVEDQGGGPIWRVLDADNYYVARWNPLEDNFRVYFVQNGVRRQLASAEVNVDAEEWHTIRIVMRGARIEAFLDGERHLELDDSTFDQPGMVGLWVKADGQTIFDDLVVRVPMVVAP